MSQELEWLDTDIVLDFHAEQLALFGGADAIRDRGLLESALSRRRNKFAYGETHIASLAAAYGFGIAKNHPFVDGNKRTPLASMIVFLGLNSFDLDAPAEAATAMMLSLAAGEVTEEFLARWLNENVIPLAAPGIVP